MSARLHPAICSTPKPAVRIKINEQWLDFHFSLSSLSAAWQIFANSKSTFSICCFLKISFFQTPSHEVRCRFGDYRTSSLSFSSIDAAISTASVRMILLWAFVSIWIVELLWRKFSNFRPELCLFFTKNYDFLSNIHGFWIRGSYTSWALLNRVYFQNLHESSRD